MRLGGVWGLVPIRPPPPFRFGHDQRRPSAHATLDQLKQTAAAERVKQRELDAQLDAAKVKVEAAGAAITDAYVAEDDRAAAKHRKDLQAAEAEVLDLQHRHDAAGPRVERAQAEADTFQAQHARELLDEGEAEAHKVAATLTAAALEAVRAHHAYVTTRTDIDELVAAVPGATSRADGPEPSHPWESRLRDLERVIRDAPEVPAPLPRWTGLNHRHGQDHANRLERDKRSGETAARLATSGQWVTLK